MKEIMNSCFSFSTTAAYKIDTVLKAFFDLMISYMTKANHNLEISFTQLGLKQLKKVCVDQINFSTSF